MTIVDRDFPKTFIIIPNAEVVSELATDYTVEITDEQKNTILGVYNLVNPFNSGSILRDDLIHLKLNDTSMIYTDGFFTAKFFLDNQLIYKDKIFSTTQNIQNYSINRGMYSTPNIANNDYIII